MDPAQEIELNALRHQRPMNDVIGDGDSPVQQFYRGATVFVTGGSGFIGKQLIEKLFRSCEVKKLFLLSRSKQGRKMEARLQHMLKDPVYDNLREKQPQFADLIVPVEGNIADIRLGLKDMDWYMLTEEVNIIFHVAATIRFDEPLRLATLTNLRGTREVLTLAKQCTNFKHFIHMSTAFTHATQERIDTDVLEQFYPSPIPPDLMISIAEQIDETKLDNITAKLIDVWPNTYTFTKALAEELIRTSAGELPVCIVRPSIVLPSYYEPNPGWLHISTLGGPSGIVLGGGLGVVHTFRAYDNAYLYVAPVDYVNNATIAAAWDSTQRRRDGEKDVPIYTIKKNIQFGLLTDTLRNERHKLSSPAAVWKSGIIQIKNKYLHVLLSIFLHYIPAYCLDFICMIIGRKPKEITSFVDIYKKLDKLNTVYDYFVNNEWHLKDDKLYDMIDRMSATDKAIFNCNVNKIDLHEYIMVWAIGIRKYMIKDGLKNTDAGYRKYKIFTVANYIVLALYMYVIWYVFSISFMIVKNIILLF